MAVANNSGQLIQLAVSDVKSRRRNYLADAEKHLSGFKDWQNLERHDRLALGRYAFKAAGKEGGNSRLPPAAELGVLSVEKGSEEILRATSCLTAAFSPRQIITELMQGKAPDHHDEVFKGEDRLYFELSTDLTRPDTQVRVAEELEGMGYTVLDYKGGYCTDRRLVEGLENAFLIRYSNRSSTTSLRAPISTSSAHLSITPSVRSKRSAANARSKRCPAKKL